MTTKSLSRKQIIISISTNKSKAIVPQANIHISNINRLLKGMKSEISADFIHFNNKGVIITTNKAVASSDLNVVEKYVKDLNNIDLNNVMSLQLSQSKLYLKILEILYFLENTYLSITSNLTKEIIKDTHIFNVIVLVSVSCPYVIKASPKLDIAVI